MTETTQPERILRVHLATVGIVATSVYVCRPLRADAVIRHHADHAPIELGRGARDGTFEINCSPGRTELLSVLNAGCSATAW